MILEGRRALVTGAAQGIGLAITRKFIEEGAAVAAVDLQASPSGKAVIWDLSDVGSMERLASSCEEAVGPINLLVNCAGICPTEATLSSKEATWDKVFRVNVYAPFFLTQVFADRWIEREEHASVVNLASISGFLPKLEQACYGASKAALVSLTRSYAASLGPHGIRVNAVAPGVIRTPLTESIARQRGEIRGVSPEETLAPVIGATPLRRIGEPGEVAELVAILASGKAGYVTGQTLLVDGGSLMR